MISLVNGIGMDRSVEFREIALKATSTHPTNRTKSELSHSPYKNKFIIQPIIKDSNNLASEIKELNRMIELKRASQHDSLPTGSILHKKDSSRRDTQFYDEMGEALTLCLSRIAMIQEKTEEVSQEESAKQRASFAWLIGGNQSKPSQLSQHLAAVVWFLNHNYSMASKAFEKLKTEAEAYERIIQEQLEKRTSLLASNLTTSKQGSKQSPVLVNEINRPSEESFAAKYSLSEQQLQTLIRENDVVFQELSDMQSQVRQTEKSMNEIARLQATLQESLLYQEATIERLDEDAEMTMEMVRKGNAMLHRAANNQSSFRNVMVVLIFVLTFVLLFLHYYSD